MFSEDVVGLVEEMGFQPSSEVSSTDGCWAEVDREGIPDDWCCNVEMYEIVVCNLWNYVICYDKRLNIIW